MSGLSHRPAPPRPPTLPAAARVPLDRHALTVAAVLAVLGAVLGVLAHAYRTFPGDTRLAAWARALGDGYAPVAHVFNDGNLAIGLGLTALAFALLLWRRRPGDALVVIVAVCLRALLHVPRAIVDRPRPAGDFLIRATGSGPSFPSGHTMSAVAAFGLWYLLAPALVPPRWVVPVRAVAVAGVLLTALSRVWGGVHWPSDTYGAVIWMGAALALAMALRPAFARATAGPAAPGS